MPEPQANPTQPAVQRDPDLENFVRSEAAQNGLDPELVSRVILNESNWKADAISPKGARGLMQIMPETAQRWGVTPEQLANPKTNISIGIHELKRLADNYGYKGDKRWATALAAYNAGEGAVDRLGPDEVLPNIPETQNYVQKILRGYEGGGYFQQPQQQQTGPQKPGYQPLPTEGLGGLPGAARFSAYNELGQGFIKGAKETGQGLAKAFNFLSQSAEPTQQEIQSGQRGPAPLQVPFQGQDLSSKTPLQTVGKVGENIMEFMAGDEALKGLSMAEKLGLASKVTKIAEKYPTIANILNAGMNATRTGVLAGGQTAVKGGTPKEIAENALLGAGTVFAIEGGAAVLKPGIAKLFDQLNLQNEAEGIRKTARETLDEAKQLGEAKAKLDAVGVGAGGYSSEASRLELEKAYQEAISKADRFAADSAKRAATLQGLSANLGPMTAKYGFSAFETGKMFWDLANGNIAKARNDAALAIGGVAATKFFGEKAVQEAIGKGLDFASQASEIRPLKEAGVTDAVKQGVKTVGQVGKEAANTFGLPMIGGLPGGAEDAAKAAGLLNKGELVPGSNVFQFEHPKAPGLTMAISGDKITDAQSIRNAMADKLEAFAKGGGSTLPGKQITPEKLNALVQELRIPQEATHHFNPSTGVIEKTPFERAQTSTEGLPKSSTPNVGPSKYSKSEQALIDRTTGSAKSQMSGPLRRELPSGSGTSLEPARVSRQELKDVGPGRVIPENASQAEKLQAQSEGVAGPAPRGKQPAELASLRGKVNKALDRELKVGNLSKMESELVKMRFGIGSPEMSNEDIAREMNVNPQTVAARWRVIKGKLSRSPNFAGLRDELEGIK